jgi:CBS domain-containing protein
MTNSKLLSRLDVTPVSPSGIKTDVRTEGRAPILPITDAVTLRPDEPIGRAIRLLNRSRLSALPVVDASSRMVGFITERDLLTRLTSRRRSWWSSVWAENKELIEEYRKAEGATVGEVMGPPPTPVPAAASLRAAADLVQEQGLRELPVVAEGRVVGMITRPSLLALLELSQPRTGPATDAELVAEMKNRLHQEPWVTNRGLWVQATDGVLFFAGLVESEEEQAALEIMARTIPGCTGVENHTFPKTALRGRWV